MRRTYHALALALVWASTVSAQTPASNGKPATIPPQPLHEKPAALDEQLITFDDRLADLLWTNGHWQLWAGPHLLKDFGRNETEGRRALALIRELHLTQRGTVGSPRTIMEYWLADGRAPTGMFPGWRTIPIDQASLRVEQTQGYWFVRDNSN